MLSIVRTTSPQTSYAAQSKSRFKTVLGFSTSSRNSSDTDTQATRTEIRNSAFTRQSIDTARSYTSRRKNRADRGSVTNISFFRPVDNTTAGNQTPVVDLTLDLVNNMTIENTLSNPSGMRPPVRMDAQEGPWSISVAETPHDAQSYSLYIKSESITFHLALSSSNRLGIFIPAVHLSSIGFLSKNNLAGSLIKYYEISAPTHNLTLTRTAREIGDLDRKLRESHPSVKLPAFPVDMQSLPSPPPPKRKSNFLNTLSRLASPTSSKIARSPSSRRFTNSSAVSTGASPLTSPSGELGDPFTSFTASNLDSSVTVSPSTTSTAIAAYLTTISNIVALRQARVWKRFVRVRTDDLESVRVERAIKRVRSDLAAHVGLVKEKESLHMDGMQNGSSVAPSESQSILDHTVNGNESHEACEDGGALQEEEAVKEEEEVYHKIPNGDLVTNGGLEEATHAASESPDHESATVNDAAEPAPMSVEEASTTPVASEPLARIHRSHSADFDKSSRLSRTYSAPSQDTSSQTGDESSASTTGGGARRSSGRKKRSMSMAPKEPKKSLRKVNIDDFEMMRVLGKGCAGKVLLVRHKATTDLYALKAITKRHVLAHQELQHTLTEQAVLKRMAAESRDPFVVKLWWSFHDKENLFLVMVRTQ
jgi:serum/glucocorticoid-regulated kinase 2